MTDETCGAPTGDGGECSNPATEDGHCWLEGHGGDTTPGRDFTIDESDHADILEAAREGLSKAGCARAAGATKDSLRRYVDAHPEFRADFARAREHGERRLVKDGLRDPDTDGQMARFLLSTSFDYVKTEKREHDIEQTTTHELPEDEKEQLDKLLDRDPQE